ncbi:MAG: hypothetical protein HOU81_13325 [Hamadaea sp.]|uniref:hypothetical protein n=1 Tax=Hamadaea sp. TaxID=2024425 RepID=UPI001816ABBC|nr:hypothetical protein [Hamadaea sp.]NUR71798.1 hypothetical protein [Hamadaea sp.]NUT23676.1 hypothetical protein [Hamadaea sp.]
MSEDWFSDALREQIGRAEPPLGITARQAIAAGRRKRRAEMLRMATAAMGAGFVLFGAVFYLEPFAGGAAAGPCDTTVPTNAPTPLPAGSEFPFGDNLPGVGPSTDAQAQSVEPTGLPSSSHQPKEPDVPDSVSPEQLDKFTCAVRRGVAAVLPGTKFAQLRDAYWTGPPPLTAGVSTGFAMTSGGVLAGAATQDRLGRGSVVIEAGPVRARPEPDRCLTGTLCTLRTGPHGEVIEVYQTSDPDGMIGYVLYVYTGQTAVVARTHNTADADGRWPVSRPTPPLTLDQLVAVACDPDLVLWR